MRAASQHYLVELADEFLASMSKIGWQGLHRSARGQKSWGETTFIDARDEEPGVDVSTSFQQLDDGSIEIEVVAFDDEDDARSIVRKAVVSP